MFRVLSISNISGNFILIKQMSPKKFLRVYSKLSTKRQIHYSTSLQEYVSNDDIKWFTFKYPFSSINKFSGFKSLEIRR